MRSEEAQQLTRARSQGASLIRTASAREVRSNINEEVLDMLEPVLFWGLVMFQLAEIIVSIVILKLSWGAETSQPLKTWLIVWICVRGFPLLISLLGKAWPSTEPPASLSASSGASSTPAAASAPAAAAPASGASDQQQDSSEGFSWKKAFDNLAGSLAFAWWIRGIIFVSRCDGCKESAYMLWTLCIVLICLNGTLVNLVVAIPCALCLCLPCLLPILLLVVRLAPRIRRTPGHQAATRPELASLPKMPFGQDLMPAEDANCVMCLEAYEAGVELRQLPCSHYFHRKCIDTWLAIKRTCPLCREDVSRPPPAVSV
eukprot:tig00020629_g12466.t1